MKTKIKGILCSISPELTTKLMFYYNFHKKLDLSHPTDINEKIQYLKLKVYSNNPTVTQCVDKYRVRSYLEDHNYSYLLPELLGGPYTSPEEVERDWNNFPNQFVIKCNHGCGYNIIVHEKTSMNLDQVKEQLRKWLREDFWKVYCEPQYKDVPKRIIVEEYLGCELSTYKFFCMNGTPKFMYYSTNPIDGENETLDFFDMDWNWLPISRIEHPNAYQVDKPQAFEQMKTISKDLAKEFPFVRVDFYVVNNKPYFSELTFVPTGGNMKLNPPEILEEWGNMLQL